MPKVTDGPVTGSFPVDLTGLPTMQLPALPKELFPEPNWQLPPRRRGAIEWEEKVGLAPPTRRPSPEGLTADSATANPAVDDLPTWVLPAIPIPAQTVEAPEKKRRRFALGGGLEGYFALVGGLLKSSGVYALASMASPLISLVLAPFVTHHLSKLDYGALAVVSTTISLAAGLSQLGLGSAFFRAYNYDFTSRSERRSVLATAGALLTFTSLPLAALAVLLAPLIAMLLFGNSSHSQLIVIGAGVLLLQNLSVPSFAFLRAENRALLYALLSTGNLLVNMAFTIYFVGPLNWGGPGSLLATGLGYAFVVLCTAPFMLIRSRIHLRFDIARSMLAFGVPQVFSLVSFWVLQWSDRLLLSLMRSASETATYAIAYSLGTVISTMVISPFTLAWPTTMYSIAKREDGPRVFANVFRWYSLLLLFGAFGLSVVGRFILVWLFPPSYDQVEYIIPIIATSIAFYGLYVFLMTGVSLKRKTWLASLFMTIAAALNFACNLVLIPLLGASGAALATLVAYAVLAVLAYVGNQRLYHIPYQVGPLISVIAMGLGLYLISYAAPEMWGEIWQWPSAIVALLIFSLWMLISGRWVNTTASRVKPQQPVPAYSDSRRSSHR
jgi:O-antigen/teichoic acid export membrane protein